MNKINLKVLLVVLAVSLVVLFVGNYLMNSYQLNRAMYKDLVKLEEVKDVEIDELKTGYKVKFFLTEVDDLQNLFVQIKDRVEKELTEEEYQLVFTSEAPLELEEVEGRVNLALYEALKTGEFVQLGDRINDYKREYKLDTAKIKIDNNYIYLSMIKDGKTFYKVIERNTEERLGGELDG